MKVGNVQNPDSGVNVGTFKVHTYKWVKDSTTNIFINSMTETVVFDLSGTFASTTSLITTKFEPGKKIKYSSKTFLNHKIMTPVDLKTDDLIITELPLPLRLTVFSTKNKEN